MTSALQGVRGMGRTSWSKCLITVSHSRGINVQKAIITFFSKHKASWDSLYISLFLHTTPYNSVQIPLFICIIFTTFFVLNSRSITLVLIFLPFSVEKRTLLNNILRRKANCIGHILRRNCLHDVIEGQTTKVKGVGRRRTQLLDDLRNRRKYWGL